MTQDSRDAAFFRAWRRWAYRLLWVIFGSGALLGFFGLAGPVDRLLRRGEVPAWSEVAGALAALLVCVVGFVAGVMARRVHVRKELVDPKP